MQSKLKRLISTLLAVALVFGLFTVMPQRVCADWAVALETEANSFKVFQKVNTYESGQFTDVDKNAWYGFNQQKSVASVYEYSLMKGVNAANFNPSGNMTIAEAITIAARVHSIYKGVSVDFTQSEPWYQVYADYAVDNGIISAADFPDIDKAATRAEMAYIFSRTSVPILLYYFSVNGYSPNTVNSLPDVNSETPYHKEIITLYMAGVLTGNDDEGTFSPDSDITRAEAAAIIIRVIMPGTRVSGNVY